MRGNGGGVTVQSANSANTPGSTGSIAANTSSCVDERHLDVELVELARRAVGARVLVAEAGRDLEVAVEARHHQQLLELLRRLRQRVELAGMNAARHQVVARALGRARGQDRRLELDEALLDHAPADARDDLRAQHDVARASSRGAGRGSGSAGAAPRESPACRRPGTAAARPPTAPRARRPTTSMLAGRQRRVDVLLGARDAPCPRR